MISPAHPMQLLRDEPIQWKPYERAGDEPCAAMPFLTATGQEWAPLCGAGNCRLCLRAFRLEEDDKGQPIRETMKKAKHMIFPLQVSWGEETDAPPENVVRLKGLPGWWLLFTTVLGA